MDDWGDNYSGDINATPSGSVASGSGFAAGLPAGLALLGAMTSYNGYQAAASATVAAGQSQAAMYQFKAAQDQVNAGQAIAASQAAAAETARQGALATSHNLAMAAAGGTAGGITPTNLVAKQAGFTSYQMALNLYQGEDTARQLTIESEADTMSGEAAIQDANAQASAMDTKASGSLISGAASLFSKYGASFFTSGA